MYKSQISWMVARNASSRGVFCPSHMCTRHGLRRWDSRMRRTVSLEMLSTRPSSSSWRASSVQSHCESDRPTSRGNSQASLTMWIAISGGKSGLASAPALVAKTVEPFLDESRDPLSNHLSGKANDSCGLRQALTTSNQQHGPSTAHHACPHISVSQPPFKLITFRTCEGDNQGGFPTAHANGLLSKGLGDLDISCIGISLEIL